MKTIRRCSLRADQLSKGEEALRVAMPPHRRAVLKGKRIKLVAEMLNDCDHPDSSLPGEISAGVW